MQLVEQTLEVYFEPLGTLPKIEATIRTHEESPFAFHVKPADDYVAFVAFADALSLHTQRIAERLGIDLPDLRFRAVCDAANDGLELHFGTLESATLFAEELLLRQINRVETNNNTSLFLISLIDDE